MSKKKRANGFGKSCIQKTIPRKRKKERRCLKRQLRSLNNSFLIQEFCFRKNHNDKYENIMPCSNTKMSVDLVKPCTINSNVGGARSGPNLLDKTIDLCSDESSNCVDQLLVSPKPSIENSEVIIDLCGDTSDQNDVIFIDSEELLNKDKKIDTMVVDLSQDDEPIQNKTFTPNDVNDDVLVIGTYKKIPLSTSDSNRINNFVKCVAKINKNTRDSKEKIMLNFDRGRNMKMNYKAEENWRKHLRNNWRKHLPTGSKVGENVYLNSPVNLPKSGLRPIIIDGSNVAFR